MTEQPTGDEEQLRYYTDRARTLARAVMALLAEYEEQHPKGAPCFMAAVGGMRQVVES